MGQLLARETDRAQAKWRSTVLLRHAVILAFDLPIIPLNEATYSRYNATLRTSEGPWSNIGSNCLHSK